MPTLVSDRVRRFLAVRGGAITRKVTERRHLTRNHSSDRAIIGDAPIVVSLTSFGPRLPTAFFAIESIAAGTRLPRRIMLWLCDEDYEKPLPVELKRLVDRGLEVRACIDLGPFKKFYPYISSQGSIDLSLVTADDDALYPRRWLQRFVQAVRQQPDTILAYRARSVQATGKALTRYSDWPLCRSARPSYTTFATGVSGVLYPPRFLDVLRSAGDGFLTACPTADDIWMHFNAVLHGFKVQQMRPRAAEYRQISGTQTTMLGSQNVIDGRNDAYISNLYNDIVLSRLLHEILPADSRSRTIRRRSRGPEFHSK